MDRKEQLVFCKQCRNQKFDPQRGIICGLTDAPADFEGTCPDFDQKVPDRFESSGNYTYKSHEPERGGCLMVYIVLIVVGGTFGTIVSLVGAINSSDAYYSVPVWYYLIAFAMSVSNILAAVLIYNWKKLGFYLLVGGMTITLLTRLAVGVNDPMNFLGVLIGLGIAFGVIMPKWEHFS